MEEREIRWGAEEKEDWMRRNGRRIERGKVNEEEE